MSATSTRRRSWLFLIGLTSILLWYRKYCSSTRAQPKWDVVDFQIKPQTAKDDSTSVREGSYRDGQLVPSKDQSTQVDSLNIGGDFHQQQISFDELQDKILDFIQWNRPSTDHWPAWHDYDQAAYDPNRWEALDRYSHSS